MFEYAVTLRAKSGTTYNLKLKKAEDSIPKAHDLMEHHILQRDFLWTDEEFMLRTSEIEAFHVKRLPTLQENHDKAMEKLHEVLEVNHVNRDVKEFVHWHSKNLRTKVPELDWILNNFKSELADILKYQEENKND